MQPRPQTLPPRSGHHPAHAAAPEPDTKLSPAEALRLRWENINLKVGTLCAVDTKNRSDHVLPMGRHLWELMRRRRRAATRCALPKIWVTVHSDGINRYLCDQNGPLHRTAYAVATFFPDRRLAGALLATTKRIPTAFKIAAKVSQRGLPFSDNAR